ncbi:hypothetical protein PTSG_05867 [Salpingoeca rosetta]|uniref:Uncharacterized protein n=1 Tax=Salpingoeca rosetta (strain ATCC 50818 / BSB-021) TaxID=946362 RepID=F2UD08_SALR5|nr:uncharacterized protein PTSG_05867 [Salpingoeca rosetta]EGD74503.1 hypothetical protein PTSG_05867 [Salpingoeca rosetta]|eukprot:XP_004992760.1 hypothetical protein PTSG_05867 [Salpingoeca rosetta]
MVAADKELEQIALEGALCVKGKRYYSKTDEANRRFWFEQVTHRSKTDKISAYTYRDAQTKPRQATHAEVQLTADLAAMGVPRSAYLVEAEMKKTHETNVATPDIKFHSPTTINGACVQWIDVKSGLTFPRTSCPRLLHDFGRKLRKYVDMHGPGLVLMHQVPLSAQLEQWALRVLGEERAAKVTFWTRIRQHTTTTVSSRRSSGVGRHKRGSGGSRGSGDSKGSGGSRSDEHRHHHHRQQRQQRQQRTCEQDGETATNMGRLLQRHGERELSSFMNSNYQDYQDDHSVSSSGSNTRDSSVDSSASSLHMLGDGYGYGYDANCGNTRAYANTPVTTSAPASPETRRRNSGVSRPNGRQPHHPHPNARWGHGGDQKHLHRRRRRHTRSVSTPPGLDGLTTTRSTEGTQDQEEQRQTEVYVPPHRRRTRH